MSTFTPTNLACFSPAGGGCRCPRLSCPSSRHTLTFIPLVALPSLDHSIHHHVPVQCWGSSARC
eukprot:scaffold5041_cov197-Pinguiococcus_pyrenoidosus.AAC.1